MNFFCKILIIFLISTLYSVIDNQAIASSNATSTEIEGKDLNNNEEDWEITELTNYNSIVYDPFEKFNRTIFKFNSGIDKLILKPIAKTYLNILPNPSHRKGVKNFLNNLCEPSYALNSLLQGNLRNFFLSTSRFIINSTFGILGLYDVAGKNKIYSKPLKLSSTMSYYGIEAGPYLVLPFLGPSTIREATGIYIDFEIDPINISLSHNNHAKIVYYRLLLSFISERSELLGFSQNVSEISLDEYAMVRSLYIQHINNLTDQN